MHFWLIHLIQFHTEKGNGMKFWISCGQGKKSVPEKVGNKFS